MGDVTVDRNRLPEHITVDRDIRLSQRPAESLAGEGRLEAVESGMDPGTSAWT